MFVLKVYACLLHGVGLLYQQRKQWETAITLHNKAIAVNSQYSLGWYSLGFCYNKTKQWTEAERCLRAFLALNATHALGQYRLGVALEKQSKCQDAIQCYTKSIELSNGKPEKRFYEHRAACLKTVGQRDKTLSDYRDMIALHPKDPSGHALLVESLNKYGLWWQLIEAIEPYIALQPNNGNSHRILGNACMRMKRFPAAAQAFATAGTFLPDNAELPLNACYAYTLADNVQAADKQYQKALRLLPKNSEYHRFGIGAFFQKKGLWTEAAEAYTKQVQLSPVDAELHYRLALSHDRCYRWAEAAKSYHASLQLEPWQAYRYYRLACVCERGGDAAGAIRAFRAALEIKTNKEWAYRLGYVLDFAGRHQEACESYLLCLENNEYLTAFAESLRNTPAAADGMAEKEDFLLVTLQESIARDATQASSHGRAGDRYRLHQNWTEAAKAYQAALDRSESYSPALFGNLGFVLAMAGRYQEACLAFRELQQIKRPHAVGDLTPYMKNVANWSRTVYLEYLETLPIRSNVILYESYRGVEMSCHPYAIFQQLMGDSRYKDYLHVWVCADKQIIPEYLLALPNIIFVTPDTDLYLRFLASAAYLINNSTFKDYFIRRDGQKYLNTWHGTPLKTLGKDERSSFMALKNTTRNFLHTTHMISPNRHTTNVLLDRYDIGPIYAGKMAELGSPRLDVMLTLSECKKKQLRDKLNLPEGLPVVLYAPTWRGIWESAVFNEQKTYSDLQALTALPCVIIFRGHQHIEEKLREMDLPVRIAGRDINTSELLSITDILITDYSSIFFDFFPLRRPVLFYVYDHEEYAATRGLYFSFDEIPGDFCVTLEDLCHSLRQHLDGAGDKKVNNAILSQFSAQEDGHSSARCVEFLFNDATTYCVNTQKTNHAIVFYGGGFSPNGITASLLNLLHALPEKYTCYVTINPNEISALPERLEKFSQCPPQVKVLARVGGMLSTVEELWISQKHASQYKVVSTEMETIYRAAHRRELVRMFGATVFEAYCNFDGYSIFWGTLFANAPTGRKTIYLHNDMYNEWTLKYPHMERLFSCYRHYDAMISVSQDVMKKNNRMLAALFGIDPLKFLTCNNTILPEKIREQSLHQISDELLQWIDETDVVFINMARISIEKCHDKLVQAFSMVHKRHSNTKLLIVGDGVLRASIEKMINDLGLNDAVRMTGYCANPFPLLAKADCFVLSSDHEGQPMTILESFALQRPVIVTDILAAQSFRDESVIKIVPNSVEGVAQGMEDFAQGDWKPVVQFDFDVYAKKTLDMFERAVIANDAQ